MYLRRLSFDQSAEFLPDDKLMAAERVPNRKICYGFKKNRKSSSLLSLSCVALPNLFKIREVIWKTAVRQGVTVRFVDTRDALS